MKILLGLNTAIFITLLGLSSAHAQLLNEDLPRSFSQNEVTLTQRGMGNACLATKAIQDGLPCSPSFIALQDKNEFLGSIYLGNGFNALQATNNLLYTPITQAYLKSLFGSNSVLETEANGVLTFLTKHFAAQFDPYHVTYFSEISNPAYPIIAVHAMNEKSFNFMYGAALADNLYGGVGLRLVNRTFIHTEFSLFDATTADPNTLLSPQTQNAIYLEPAVTYSFNYWWKTKVTVMAQNTGIVDQQYPILNYNPHVGVGLGVIPPLKWGVLDIDLDYKDSLGTGILTDDLYIGASYRIGAIQAIMGANSEAFSGGLVFTMSGVQVGIVYSTTQFPGTSSDYFDQTVYTQFGVVL